MESIVAYPENAEQLRMVKAILKALKVEFEPQPETLPAHFLKGIAESRKQHQNGQSISLQEFK